MAGPAKAVEEGLALSPAAYARTLLLAAALGVPVAFAAVLFQTAIHDLSQLVWEELPNAFGWEQPASWYVLLVPALAGLVVAGSLRLPGRGGHGPLDGFGFDGVRPLDLASILPASLASLSFGLVLGPEAPLLALGLVLGVVASRLLRESGPEGQLLGLAGAFAAIAALFGGPLPAALLLFEAVAASGAVPARALGRALLPGFLAAGTAMLVFTGVRDWPGVEQVSLSLPALDPYPTVRLVDFAWGIVIALGAAVVTVAVTRGAHAAAVVARARPTASLVGAGLLVGACAVAFRAAADRPVDFVLFSGQAALPEIVAEGSAAVLVLLVGLKALAYGLSLAAGFRGGPVFPAVALGAAVGMLAEVTLPGLEPAPAIAAGIAAAGAAVLHMPFFAVLLAALLVGDAALEAAPIAIVAATVGWLVAMGARGR